MIEGLEHLEKEGWELVRVGKPVRDIDWVVGSDGFPVAMDWVTDRHNLVIIRKIEKPKRYRPFANKAEFAPHRDRWVVYKSKSGDGAYSSHLPTSFDDNGVVIGGSTEDYDEAFLDYGFDNFDGTTEPFGVEVQS